MSKFGHPAPFAVHVHHGPGHVDLLLRIEQRQQLVQVSASVPQGEHRVAVLPLRDAAHAAGAQAELRLPVAACRDLDTVHGLRMAELHQRILPVHILQDVRVDQRVVQGSVEDGLLLIRAARHPDAAKLVLPSLLCLGLHGRKVKPFLFGLQVLPCIVDAHERDAYLQHHPFALGQVLVAEPVADVVAGKIAGVGLV